MRQIQIAMSPYFGEVDFSGLGGCATSGAALDAVSLADIYRNAFVYPPHSIYTDVKLATFGFNTAQDMGSAPEFRLPPRRRSAMHTTEGGNWVATYHQLLCEAVTQSCADIRLPWMLQSGGKDSTSLAIAVAAARPDTQCLTYLGGREEDEVASARTVAQQLGLRHEALVCDPGRAYDRYLALVSRMPLLTGDFALLSYADLVTEIAQHGGDGVLDGLGSDIYFGAPATRQQRLLERLSWRLPLPRIATDSLLASRHFETAFVLATLQMDRFERFFPGSRFTDAEVDGLFGTDVAWQSRRRLEVFRGEIEAATNADGRRTLSAVIAESTAAFAKGLYTTSALSMRAAYPFCDERLREWISWEVPPECLVDPRSGANKALVREHIAEYFGELPYVTRKGSFRFDLCGLALQRFEQVHAFAAQTRGLLPGAIGWLERNRGRLGNKYHASKFYLLAVTLPWIRSRMADA
jgi:asparagine synthetase B (glutamine-hydrolysing)